MVALLVGGAACWKDERVGQGHIGQGLLVVGC